MNASELMEAIGVGLAAAKQPNEVCIEIIDLWSICMTKGEWASWAQFLGTICAIAGAFLIANRTEKKERKKILEIATVEALLKSIAIASKLKANADKLSVIKQNLLTNDANIDSVRTLFGDILNIKLPNVESIVAISKVNFECAKSLSIASESQRQLIQNCEYVLYSEMMDGNNKFAISSLVISLEFHVVASSLAVNKFLEINKVPLDHELSS